MAALIPFWGPLLAANSPFLSTNLPVTPTSHGKETVVFIARRGCVRLQRSHYRISACTGATNAKVTRITLEHR